MDAQTANSLKMFTFALDLDNRGIHISHGLSIENSGQTDGFTHCGMDGLPPFTSYLMVNRRRKPEIQTITLTG